MEKKKILFDKFEFPVLKGLQYLRDEEKPVTDYLFVNRPDESFSMYFEQGMKPYTPPTESATDEYLLFEVKRSDRIIRFYCPARHNKKLRSMMWYFYVELFDADGTRHGLPGQMRVTRPLLTPCALKKKPKFFEILENVAIATTSL